MTLPPLTPEQEDKFYADLRAAHRRNMGDFTDDVDPVGCSGAVLVNAADITPKPISWLWLGRIPRGKVTMISGDPGLSKSLLTIDTAARVSTGASWPDGAPCSVGSVLMLSAEDDLADTIRPRLDAAGADPSRVHFIQGVRDPSNPQDRFFSLASDIKVLTDAIATIEDCSLIVIDPISAYLGGTDSHKNADIRGLLAPLADFAASNNVAVVVVSHLNKASKQAAIYRTMGSLAFVAAARAAYVVARDEDEPDRRLFLPMKCNLSPDTNGLAYSVKATVSGIPFIEWEHGTVEIRADEALSFGDENRSALDDAIAWLQEELKIAKVHVKELQGMARRDGHSWRTVERAKEKLRVESVKDTFTGKWFWRLPNPASFPSDGGVAALAAFDQERQQHRQVADFDESKELQRIPS